MSGPRAAVTTIGLGFLPTIAGAWQVFVTPARAIDQQTYDIHMSILWAFAAIAVLVYGVMIRTAVSTGGDPQFSGHRKAEGLWTLIPAAILFATALPAALELAELRVQGTEKEIAAEEPESDVDNVLRALIADSRLDDG